MILLLVSFMLQRHAETSQLTSTATGCNPNIMLFANTRRTVGRNSRGFAAIPVRAFFVHVVVLREIDDVHLYHQICKRAFDSQARSPLSEPITRRQHDEYALKKQQSTRYLIS